MLTPDWTLLHVFLTVADSGSLSAAARRIGSSQPTVGRQIQNLETQMNLELFHRHPKGFTLTPAGERLLPHARAMAEQAGRIALISASAETALAGTVRITASIFVAHHILPPVLADLRRAEPGIDIEIVAADSSDNLLFREADIALRMYRPTQLDVTAVHLGDVAMGAFAARSYLDRCGLPKTVEELLDHDLIGFDRSDMILRGMRAGGLMVNRDSFAFRTDHPTVYWELLRAGCGIGFGQTRIAQRQQDVVAILSDMPLPSLPLWLATATKARRMPRLVRVWDHLEDRLRGYLKGIDPHSRFAR